MIGQKKRNLTESRWLAVISAAYVFLILCLFNLLVPCMRSLPDEIGAFSLAAKIAGYDWSYVLSHPPLYYGTGSTLLFLPFFCLVKDPMVLYQCLLGVGAFLHAVTAYIACRIIQKYYKITDNSVHIVLIGVIAALFTPTRATNIDNEPMLIVLCWLMVYIFIILQHSSGKKKWVYSGLLGLLLAFSYISHTRAVIYSIAAFAVIVICYILTRKSIVNIPSFLITYGLCMWLAILYTGNIKQLLFVDHTEVATVTSNTPEAVVESVGNSISTIFEPVGIQSFFDLIFSNIWVMFVFGFGIIIFVMWHTGISTFTSLFRVFKKKERLQLEDRMFPMLFCVIGVFVSLCGVAIMWLLQAVAVHEAGANLSRGHFYLRYYGNFFGPIVLFFLTDVYEKLSVDKIRKNVIASLIVLFLAVGYCGISFLGTVSKNYMYGLDWFYYFAPFSGMVRMWPNTVQTLSYFICTTIVTVLIFAMLFICIREKKRSLTLVILLCCLLWEYGYGVSRFDRAFAYNENYYQASDGVYALSKRDPAFFAGIDELYYYNEVYGPAYIVQYTLPTCKVITDLELMDHTDKNVILSSKKLNKESMGLQGYIGIKIDNNEFIYTNSIAYVKELIDCGYGDVV